MYFDSTLSEYTFLKVFIVDSLMFHQAVKCSHHLLSGSLSQKDVEHFVIEKQPSVTRLGKMQIFDV
jgi:hypothetical protein